MRVQPAKTGGPTDGGRSRQGSQSGDDSYADCKKENRIYAHEKSRFRTLRTYAEALSGAVTCNTNFPRVWPATPRSNASLALASGIVSAMTGRIAPESINA